MKVLENNYCINLECPYCTSKLGVGKEDITYNENSEIDADCPEFETKCGACKRKIGVPAKLMPREWINSLAPDDTGH